MSYVPDLFDKSARDNPNAIVLIEGERHWTYAQMAHEVDRLAARLQDSAPGDAVGILLLNSFRYVVSMLAIWKAGKTAVPLNYLLPPSDLGFIAKDSGMSTLVSSAFFAQPLAAMKPLLGDRGLILMADDPAFLGEKPLATPAQKEPALFLYTSGTTARPKGVILTHDNLARNVASCIDAGAFKGNDCFLCLLPFFHTYGITGTMLLPVALGAKMVLIDRFQPLKVLKVIEDQRVSTLIAIPSMYRVMAASEGKFDLSCIRLAISGGEALPVAVADAFEKRFNVPICEGYGQTEAAPVVSLNTPDARKLGSVGRPLPGVEIAIWDNDDRPLPVDTVGEIMVRGANVMEGYYHLPEETAKTITNGWLHTGDLGMLDAEGFITITGRKKELIISAGENIYPREIEEVLVQHPKVKEVAVIGVKDEVRGEAPKAFVIARDGEVLDDRELRSFCRDRLANYKIPKQIEIVPDFPRTPSGKVLKRMLS